ncbi:MAG: hypothetical protein HON65_03495, partial [Rhodospirillales bacterium]|nr:hypothetical protein [Rhodospirillales bacterium]
GISLPGTGEQPTAPVFIDGEKAVTLRGEGLTQEFHDLIEKYVVEHFGKTGHNTSSTDNTD